ncbi:MAG: HEPN domain-containing protein [Candidatus Cloacimonetes bacterium]|nr:HEPN domain-containing protein [Candidatus Cloacimonadota bacterium]
MAKIFHWNTCTNRLYYSCFYAINAFLLSNQLASSKHTGVRALFNLHLMKTNLLPKEFGKMYNKLFLYRQQSDYEDLFVMKEEKVVPWISKTKEFVNLIEKLIISRS